MSCGDARRPTNGRPLSPPVADGLAFAFGPFPLSWEAHLNGPEQSRARGLGAAERTLDGEDRSGTWSGRERGRGSQGVSPWRGSGAAPRAPYCARRLRAVSRNQLAAQACLAQSVPQSRGGAGASTFTARNSAALAWRIFRAASVSLICPALLSSCLKLIPGLRNFSASGSDFNFS